MTRQIVPPEAREPSEKLDSLAADIRERHRSWLLDVRIEAHEDGLILCGRALSFYGKQMAQEELLRRGLIVLANRIRVLVSPELDGGI